MALISYAILVFFTVFPIRPFNREALPFDVKELASFDIFMEPNVLLGLAVGIIFALQKGYIEIFQSTLGKFNRRFSLLYIDNKGLVIAFFIILLSAPVVSFVCFFIDNPTPPNYIMGYQFIVISIIMVYIRKASLTKGKPNLILVAIISCISVFTSFTTILVFGLLKFFGFSWKEALILAYTAFLLKIIVFILFYGYYMNIQLSVEGLTFFMIGFIFSLFGVIFFSMIARRNSILLICLVYIILGIALILWL